jgi:2-methylisocitrate lyase-like PEP mutase family enzyme
VNEARKRSHRIEVIVENGYLHWCDLLEFQFHGQWPLLNVAYLAGKGVHVSLQGHQPFQAAVRAIHDTLKALRDGTSATDLKNLASNELMAAVTCSTDHVHWTSKFLGVG